MNRRQQLTKMIQAEKNRKRLMDAIALESIVRVIDTFEKEREKMDEEIEALIKADPILKKKSQVLCKQKGVAITTAAAVLAYVPEIGFVNRKKIAALVGLAPMADDSGKTSKKRKISGGRFNARKSLYMPAWVAVRHDPEFNQFYTRLIERGKLEKVAITAVMRKLLVRLNANMRTFLQQEYDNYIAA